MGITVVLLAGFLLGFVGSIPLAGPIALLVFSLVIDGRHRRAIGVGVGGAVAEGIYAFLAYWGLSAFLGAHPVLVPISRGITALVLAGIGIALLRRRPAAAPPLRRSWPGAGFAVGFAITALNPTLIATYSAAVATLFSAGLVSMARSEALPFAATVTAGVALWFAVVVLAGRRHSHRFRRETLNGAVRAMGAFAVLLGVAFAIWTVAGPWN